jgi:hypothetical protein
MDVLESSGAVEGRRYYGKYRGKVVDNIDPTGLGQILVAVPDVLGSVRLWAMPCVPYAGKEVGLFCPPPKDANVWVEFERGDPQYPIWSGCFWGKGELPADPKVDGLKVFKVGAIAGESVDDVFSLTIDSGKKEVELRLNVSTKASPTPLTLRMSKEGIEISYNKQAVAKLTAQAIQLNQGEAKVGVGGNLVELRQGQTTIAVAPDDIALQKSSAKITLSATGVSLNNGSQKINLSQDSVTINYPALEVK